tara:strand:- start:8401 stop:10005 length:1605 start_codon:yes stop_codon:yes gene_type:complete
MSEQITYGSYSFPAPTPFVGQGVEPVYIAGKADHFRDSIELVGNLTGENLSGLHLQKMQMVSGLMSTFQTLTISHELEDKTFAQAKPETISFSDSDLTTVLPYSVSFSSYESRSFSEFFGISDPTDTWSFNEQDGRIIDATHNVSAKGVKVDSASPLVNARHFVTGRVTGYRDLSLFLTGSTGYLMSRTEDIDKSKNTYGLQETYRYNTSEYINTDLSGVFRSDCSISYGKSEGLSVNVNASIQGDFDAIKNSEGIISTGLFTASMAQEIAVNSVVSSLSDYESGVYTFIDRGPSTASYNIDTGTNVISFHYVFSDPENLDQVGNVLHTRRSTVSASKDNSKVQVSVQGDFKYNSPFEIIPTGDPATGQRFIEIDEQYSGMATGSGFLNSAIEALQEFTGYALGYHISGDYINPQPISRSISKNPNQSSITYSLEFDNSLDLSNGSLTGLQVSLTDKKPLVRSGILPSLGGFAKQKINNRTAGELSAESSCEASTGQLQELKNVVSGHMTGIFIFSESSSLNDKSISYNISRYY